MERTRRNLNAEQVAYFTAELMRLAPQRLSVPILVDRFGLSDDQIRRLSRRAGIDTSLPLVTKRPGRPRIHPKRVRRRPPMDPAVREQRITDVRRCAAAGMSDSAIGRELSIARRTVAWIRWNNNIECGIKQVPPPPQVPPRNRPLHGTCPECFMPDVALDPAGMVAPHNRLDSAPWRGGVRRAVACPGAGYLPEPEGDHR